MSKAYCKGAVRYQGERGSHHDRESCGAASSRARRLTRRVAASMIVVFGLSLPVVASSAEGDDLHLVASSNVNLDGLSKKDVAAIFLGNRRQWSDGTRIRIAMLDVASTQKPFLQAVVERSPPQYWAHWRNIVFSGRGIMPRIFQSEEALLDYLDDQEGVIGQLKDIDLAQLRGAAVLPVAEVGMP